MRHSTALVAEQQSPTIREPLLDTPVALAEDVLCFERQGTQEGREGFSAAFQVCLPYRGLFVWHVGSDDIVGDANQVLFVSRGEPFRLTQPVPRGYAELIITPSDETLANVAGTSPAHLCSHPLFRRRSHRADPSLQRLRTRLLHRLEAGGADPLRSEEAIVELLRGAFQANGNGRPAHARTQRLIARAKTYLEENLSTPVHLHEVARSAGASPASPDRRVPPPRRDPAAPLPGSAAAVASAGRVASRQRPDGAGPRPRLLESQPLHRGVPPDVPVHAVGVQGIDAAAHAP